MVVAAENDAVRKAMAQQLLYEVGRICGNLKPEALTAKQRERVYGLMHEAKVYGCSYGDVAKMANVSRSRAVQIIRDFKEA